MKIKNDAGEEIEVFTQDELDQKLQENTTKISQEFEAKSQAIIAERDSMKASFEKAEADLNAAIAEGGGNTEQIARLRRERDEAKQRSDDAVTKLTSEMERLRTDFYGNFEQDALSRLSGGDKELEKRIKFEFDNYMPTKNSREEIQQRMEKAFQLATGSKPKPGAMTGILNGAGDKGEGGYGRKAGDIEYTPNQIAIGKVLGVTDEDRKNYAAYKSRQQ